MFSASFKYSRKTFLICLKFSNDLFINMIKNLALSRKKGRRFNTQIIFSLKVLNKNLGKQAFVNKIFSRQFFNKSKRVKLNTLFFLIFRVL